jgi:hypothetical protein
MPVTRATHGITIIIGTAHTRTRDVTYDSFLRSPWMAPQAAIAADTPQIERPTTASSLGSSSICGASEQNEKDHADDDRQACAIRETRLDEPEKRTLAWDDESDLMYIGRTA